jgi:uncharacterized protein (TIGR04222 family)
MNAQHVELWRRIERFQIDSPEAALPFSARLARENNWSFAFARRVIDQYKRFTFLAVVADHPVSPSEDVDQVWHLHLTYSENYWKVFCPETLGKPFHHQPTKGGETEKHKFEDWYARTLASYEKFFDAPPPSDIWPSAESRRDERHDFVRVDRHRNWIIPKPRFFKATDVRRIWNAGSSRLGTRISKIPIQFLRSIRESERRFHLSSICIATLGLIALLIICCGATFASSANIFDWRGPDFLTFYLFLFAVTFALGLWFRWSLRKPGVTEPIDLPQLDGYATAFLNGGKILTVNTAIANLVRQNAMHVDRNCLTSLEPKPEFSHNLEKLVYAAAHSPNGNSIGNVRASARSFVAGILEQLQSQRLVLSNNQARKAVILPLMLSLVALAIGIIKIIIGLNRGKPVSFLVGLCFLGFILSLIALARPARRTRLGDAVLKQLQDNHTGSHYLGSSLSNVSAAEFAVLMGLFGMTELDGTELSDLRRSLQPASAVSSGNSCGGSTCGSSCGSSCGGCGGCGSS